MTIESESGGKQTRGPVRSTLLYFLPTLASSLAPILVLPLLTRFLEPEDFGVYALAQAAVLVLNGILSLGVQMAFERNFHEQGKDARKESELAFACGIFLLAVATLSVAVAALCEPLVDNWMTQAPLPAGLVALSAAAVGIKGVNQLFYSFLRFADRGKQFAMISVSESVMGPLAALIAVIGLGQGIRGLAGAQVAVQVVVLFFLARISFKGQWPNWDRSQLIRVLAVGSPLTVRQVLNVASGQFDKIILGVLASSGAVGVYYIAERLANLYFLMMTALGQVFVPELYRKMFGKSESGDAGRFLSPFLFVSVGLALAVVLFSQEAFLILAPSDYRGAEHIAGLLVFSMSFLFFSKIQSAQLMFAEKAAAHSAFAVFQILLIVTVSLPLTHRFGAIGTAWATVVSRLIYVISMGLLAQRCFRIGWERRKVAMFFGYLTVTVAGTHFLAGKTEPFSIIGLSLKCAVLLIYGVVGWKLDLIPVEPFRMARVRGSQA